VFLTSDPQAFLGRRQAMTIRTLLTFAAVLLFGSMVQADPIIAISNHEAGADGFRLRWEGLDTHDFHVEWGLTEITATSAGVGSIEQTDPPTAVRAFFDAAIGSANFFRDGEGEYAVQVIFKEVAAHGSFSIKWWQTDEAHDKIEGTEGGWDPDRGIRNVRIPEPGTVVLLTCGLCAALVRRLR
jgi:hypothetical protein